MKKTLRISKLVKKLILVAFTLCGRNVLLENKMVRAHGYSSRKSSEILMKSAR